MGQATPLYYQLFVTPITITNTDSAWYIDEFGAVMAIVATCVALYFLRKGNAEFKFVRT